MTDKQIEMIIDLLTDIRDALVPMSEPLGEPDFDCRCVLMSGDPVANCPICGGTGQKVR